MPWCKVVFVVVIVDVLVAVAVTHYGIFPCEKASACADPVTFARGGPTLKTFFLVGSKKSM